MDSIFKPNSKLSSVWTGFKDVCKLCFTVIVAIPRRKKLNDFAKGIFHGAIFALALLIGGILLLLIAICYPSILILRFILGIAGGIFFIFAVGNLYCLSNPYRFENYVQTKSGRTRNPSYPLTKGTIEPKYLNNAIIYHRKYRCKKQHWYHDFCEFCGAKFSLSEPSSLKVGYALGVGIGINWICEECFEKNKDQYSWAIVEDMDGEL